MKDLNELLRISRDSYRGNAKGIDGRDEVLTKYEVVPELLPYGAARYLKTDARIFQEEPA